MNIEWNIVWGVGAILIGIYWIIKRSVPVGIEGKEPSFIAKGKWAILLGIFSISLGLFVATDAPKQLKVDECLDKGDRFNYETISCEFKKQ